MLRILQCLLRMHIQDFDRMAESCGGEGPLGEEEPSTSTSSVKKGLSSSSRSVFKALTIHNLLHQKYFLYSVIHLGRGKILPFRASLMQ